MEDKNIVLFEELQKQKFCNHNFDKSFYYPEEKEVSGLNYKIIDRWARICKKCGFTQHTKKKKSGTKNYEPDFN